MGAKEGCKLLNYQLTTDMNIWITDTENLPFLLATHGCALRKRTFSPIEQKPVHKLIHATKVVVDKGARNVETANRISECEDYVYNELQPLIKSGYFADINQDIEYEDKSEDDYDKEYSIIEMSVRLDLDNDGYCEPYIVYIDKESASLLRIEKNYEAEDVLLDASNNVSFIRPSDRYVLYTFMSDDESFFGRSLCHILEEYQNAEASIVNMLIDSGAKSALGGGFISKDLKLPSGHTDFDAGEWKPVANLGDDIRTSIVPLPVSEPSQTLITMLQYLDRKSAK